MTRRPRSLFGRIMATVALALLLGQSVAALLLYRASEERREARMVDAAALQLAIGGAADRRAARGALRGASRGLGDRPRPMRGLPPALRYRVSEAAPVAYPEWSGPTPESERIATLLAEQGIAPATIATAFRRAGDDPGLIAFARARPRFAAREQWRDRRLLVAAIQREAGGVWHVARVAEPRREPRALGTLLVQTAILFASLLGFLYWQLRRITLPLARLTGRVEHIGAPGRGSEPMPESGPEDVARLIRAYNAAEARIAALLDEKDVMLGAIGHDLKTRWPRCVCGSRSSRTRRNARGWYEGLRRLPRRWTTSSRSPDWAAPRIRPNAPICRRWPPRWCRSTRIWAKRYDLWTTSGSSPRFMPGGSSGRCAT